MSILYLILLFPLPYYNRKFPQGVYNPLRYRQLVQTSVVTCEKLRRIICKGKKKKRLFYKNNYFFYDTLKLRYGLKTYDTGRCPYDTQLRCYNNLKDNFKQSYLGISANLQKCVFYPQLFWLSLFIQSFYW